MIDWRTDLDNIPRDRDVLIWGMPSSHPKLEIEILSPVAFVAHYDSIDEAFCINGGDWMGPFVQPIKWADLNLPEQPSGQGDRITPAVLHG